MDLNKGKLTPEGKECFPSFSHHPAQREWPCKSTERYLHVQGDIKHFWYLDLLSPTLINRNFKKPRKARLQKVHCTHEQKGQGFCNKTCICWFFALI